MTTPYSITLEKVKQHGHDAKKLQAKLMGMMVDATTGKRGIDEILELSRWAGAFGGLHAYVTRMIHAKQETLKIQGIEIVVDPEVPIEIVQEMMSLSVAKPRKVEEDPATFDNTDDDEDNYDNSGDDDEAER